MFEIYTEKARRVIFFARYEASQFGSPFIGTEHLLLGLLREDKALAVASLHSYEAVGAIRKQIESARPVREKISTAIELPLSDDSRSVLAYAAEEAGRLQSKHIGTEHLLLGLLRVTDTFAAQLLNIYGVSLDSAREKFSDWKRSVESSSATVAIHGNEWSAMYVNSRAVELRKFAWRKRQWEPLDTLVETTTNRLFFDLSFRDDANFEFVQGGWPREFCSLCQWEINADDPEHSTCYTNGRVWLCGECYEKFVMTNQQSA